MRLVRVETREILFHVHNRHSRVYFWNDQGFSKTRYDKATVSEYRKLLPEAIDRLGFGRLGANFRWNIKGGYKKFKREHTTPGFVANMALQNREGRLINIHVVVS